MITMARDMAFLLGRAKMPEGFPALLAQTVDTSGPLGTYTYKLDSDYWFFLEAVLAKWTAPTVLSVPGIEIFRDGGSVGYFPQPVDFRLLTSPAEAPGDLAQLGRVIGLGMYFPAGTALRMRLTGFVGGNPAAVTMAAMGRYVRSPDHG